MEIIFDFFPPRSVIFPNWGSLRVILNDSENRKSLVRSSVIFILGSIIKFTPSDNQAKRICKQYCLFRQCCCWAFVVQDIISVITQNCRRKTDLFRLANSVFIPRPRYHKTVSLITQTVWRLRSNPGNRGCFYCVKKCETHQIWPERVNDTNWWLSWIEIVSISSKI